MGRGKGKSEDCKPVNGLETLSNSNSCALRLALQPSFLPCFLAYSSVESSEMEPRWLSCLFAPLGAALRYVLALAMAQHPVR